MKAIKYILLILCLAIFVINLYSCKKDDSKPAPTQREIKTDILVNKSNGWSLKSIILPSNSATTEDDWVDFKLSVSSSSMTTSGLASGTTAVWPSGGWTMTEDGKTITRSGSDNIDSYDRT